MLESQEEIRLYIYIYIVCFQVISNLVGEIVHYQCDVKLVVAINTHGKYIFWEVREYVSEEAPLET